MRIINQHYINGDFVDSIGKDVADLINPSTQEVIGQVVLGNEEDTQRAITAAIEASICYSKSTPEQRADYLQRLHGAIVDRLDDHIEALVKEYGAPIQMAQYLVQGAAGVILSTKEALQNMAFKEMVGDTEVSLHPVGVAGHITPWNASIIYFCNKTASALAAGCPVVTKPSEMSALQTQVIMECVHAARLPAGLINIVNGRGDVVGAEITRNPDVAKISFTGSTAVGKTIARDGATTLKRVTLELGGKSPHIILEDANLEQAIPFILMTSFMNSGQACIAGTRLLIPESRAAEIKAALKQAVAHHLKVGRPEDGDTAIGPMVSKTQYQRVQSYINKGIEEGAEVLVGGEGHPEGLENGNFVKPTIFVNVTNDMTIAREEIFGPVLCVLTYKTEEEAIEIANDTQYGLAGYVSGTDVAHARAIANRIDAGVISVNTFNHNPAAPFGGFKQSGIGRENGAFGIRSYLELKSVS